MDTSRTLTHAAGRQSPPSGTQSSRRASDGENRLESSHGAWSGEESQGDGIEEDGSRKRRRPMSVSCVTTALSAFYVSMPEASDTKADHISERCELCKQRKVKCD